MVYTIGMNGFVRSAITVGLFVLFGLVGFGSGWLIRSHYQSGQEIESASDLINPFISRYGTQAQPLNAYRTQTLATQTFTAESPITILDQLGTSEETAQYRSYLIEYNSGGKKITGQMNVPVTAAPADGYPVIVMLRGFVPENIYQTGIGTKNGAAYYASNGYVTIAPDFLGFGGSDDPPEDTWEGRFIKPINVAQLLESISTYSEVSSDSNLSNSISVPLDSDRLALWGHSNGGQIALTTLQITGKDIPTTLWAPVTAPFPYSILFFGDELPDEGREQRAWIALFEDSYNVLDFSVPQHLDLLPATTIQIHHGALDDAAPIAWTEEFIDKVQLENNRRAAFEEAQQEKISTASGAVKEALEEELQNAVTDKISIEYFRYPQADHNLSPNWNTVVQRDVSFFEAQL